jgi:peroxiredoxin
VFDFQALAHTGQRVALSEFLGKPSLFYFCPEDATPQCTQLALTIRDEWLRLNAHLDMVFAVTPAPTVVHREFASEHQLPHLLLADTDARVHEIFGLKPGMLTAYLVGAEREVLRVFPISDGNTLVARVETALAELELLRTPYPL